MLKQTNVHRKGFSKHHPYLKKYHKRLKHFSTPAEKSLSQLLRQCSIRYERQCVFIDEIHHYAYIADFYLWKYMVIIECDGSGHYTRKGIIDDKIRDNDFLASGIITIRIENEDVFNMTKEDLLLILEKLI